MTYENLTWEQAEQLAQRADDALWLDVRTPREYAQLGHVPGARNVPVQALAAFLDELRANAGPTLVVCEHGVRSVWAAATLADAGVPAVSNVRGGMSEWTGPRAFGPAPNGDADEA